MYDFVQNIEYKTVGPISHFNMHYSIIDELMLIKCLHLALKKTYFNFEHIGRYGFI